MVTQQPGPYPSSDVSFHEIYMNQASVNLQTHNKEYTNAKTSSILEGTYVPSRVPLQIPWPNTKKILRIPKAPLRHTPHNPHMKAKHNYNIVDDLSQSPVAM